MDVSRLLTKAFTNEISYIKIHLDRNAIRIHQTPIFKTISTLYIIYIRTNVLIFTDVIKKFSFRSFSVILSGVDLGNLQEISNRALYVRLIYIAIYATNAVVTRYRGAKNFLN